MTASLINILALGCTMIMLVGAIGGLAAWRLHYLDRHAAGAAAI